MKLPRTTDDILDMSTPDIPPIAPPTCAEAANQSYLSPKFDFEPFFILLWRTNCLRKCRCHHLRENSLKVTAFWEVHFTTLTSLALRRRTHGDAMAARQAAAICAEAWHISRWLAALMAAMRPASSILSPGYVIKLPIASWRQQRRKYPKPAIPKFEGATSHSNAMDGTTLGFRLAKSGQIGGIIVLPTWHILPLLGVLNLYKQVGFLAP